MTIQVLRLHIHQIEIKLPYNCRESTNDNKQAIGIVTSQLHRGRHICKPVPHAYRAHVRERSKARMFPWARPRGARNTGRHAIASASVS